MLQARQIAVRLGGQLILDQVSLRVAPGELVAVIGPNGAGKSTLLRVLSGELKPHAGTVELLGRALESWPVRELARRRAVLSQHTTLEFAFSALEVVLLGRAPHGGGAGPRELAIAYAALAAAEIEQLADRWYTTLSGGEQQRVQLARVLAQIWEPVDEQPRLLLLDEPTSSLDLAHQHHTLALARRFARHDTGVLAILHDLNLAAQYADRLLLLQRGQLLASGPPGDVLTAELIGRAFELPVHVMPHPSLPCPLVVAVPGAATGTDRQVCMLEQAP